MLTSALLIALLALAASLQPSFGALTRRQISVGTPSPLPSQCASTCNPVNNEVSLGCPVEACCATTFETQYYNCLECVGEVLDAGNYSTLQNRLDLLYTTCVDMGFVLQRLELPGQSNSSNTTSTASSSTGSGSTSASGAAELHWRAGQIEALIGVAVLLGIAGLC